MKSVNKKKTVKWSQLQESGCHVVVFFFFLGVVACRLSPRVGGAALGAACFVLTKLS